MSSTTLRRAAVSAATAAVMVGGALTVAPAASASPAPTAVAKVKLVKCPSDWNTPNENFRVDPGGARLRTGPSTSYRTRTVLNPGQLVRAVCTEASGYYPNWTLWKKVQVKSGHFKGRWGWVALSTIDD
jgi:hypothetical protein